VLASYYLIMFVFALHEVCLLNAGPRGFRNDLRVERTLMLQACGAVLAFIVIIRRVRRLRQVIPGVLVVGINPPARRQGEAESVR
jgi:hypothetical protein